MSKNSQWFSKPDCFNDPFDCQLKVNVDNQYFTSLPLYINSIGVSNKNVVQVTTVMQQCKSQGLNDAQTITIIENTLVANGYPSLRTQLMNFVGTNASRCSQMGVLSLAEKPNNLLMWAHYASFHKGYCLEFSTNENNPDTKNCILNNDAYTRKVEYGFEYPSLIDLRPFDAAPQQIEDNLLYYKSSEWKYEDEWRTIISQGNQLQPFPSKLTGVIFGAKISDKGIEIV